MNCGIMEERTETPKRLNNDSTILTGCDSGGNRREEKVKKVNTITLKMTKSVKYFSEISFVIISYFTFALLSILSE
jgi:hypothetical protein